jgi:hypothetical protein
LNQEQTSEDDEAVDIAKGKQRKPTGRTRLVKAQIRREEKNLNGVRKESPRLRESEVEGMMVPKFTIN